MYYLIVVTSNWMLAMMMMCISCCASETELTGGSSLRAYEASCQKRRRMREKEREGEREEILLLAVCAFVRARASVCLPVQRVVHSSTRNDDSREARSTVMYMYMYSCVLVRQIPWIFGSHGSNKKKS